MQTVLPEKPGWRDWDVAAYWNLRLICVKFNRQKPLEKTMRFIQLTLIVLSLLAAPATLFAGEADVVDVTIQSLGNGKFRINATLRHADTGWDHYADRWDVLDEQGNVIGVRDLAHPHVNEQPFTRSVTVTIASTIKTITIRANDSVHELGGATFDMAVPHP